MFVAPSSIGSFDPRYTTDVKLLHPENVLFPIDFTEDGMIIDTRFLQSLKASCLINVTFDDDIFTVFKLIHPENAKSLMSVTPDGIMNDVRLLQF